MANYNEKSVRDATKFVVATITNEEKRCTEPFGLVDNRAKMPDDLSKKYMFKVSRWNLDKKDNYYPILTPMFALTDEANQLLDIRTQGVMLNRVKAFLKKNYISTKWSTHSSIVELIVELNELELFSSETFISFVNTAFISDDMLAKLACRLLPGQIYSSKIADFNLSASVWFENGEHYDTTSLKELINVKDRLKNAVITVSDTSVRIEMVPNPNVWDNGSVATA